MTRASRLDVPGVRPTIGDLRRVRDLLADVGDASAAIVVRALTAILAGDDPVAALGLRASAGQRSALTVDRAAIRDGFLRDMADRHWPGLSLSMQAREIGKAAAGYDRRAARLDVGLEDMPASYVGMPREFLFHIARLPAPVPSERTIRLVLADRARSLAASGWYSLPAEGPTPTPRTMGGSR